MTNSTTKSSSNPWPQTITAGGWTRTVSDHLKEMSQSRADITAERVEYVLEHWVVRGIHTAIDETQSWVYFAMLPDLGKMVRVAVSIDDERIATAFPDTQATNHWNRRNTNYFERKYGNVEVRDES